MQSANVVAFAADVFLAVRLQSPHNKKPGLRPGFL
jgi:hypothetical protein